MDGVFLRPKCYSLLLSNGKAHKRTKGVQRCVVRNELQHEDYVAVVESAAPIYSRMRGFRSVNHTISTVTTDKRALSLFEDKRSWQDAHTSFAYGHYKINSSTPSSQTTLLSIMNSLFIPDQQPITMLSIMEDIFGPPSKKLKLHPSL